MNVLSTASKVFLGLFSLKRLALVAYLCAFFASCYLFQSMWQNVVYTFTKSVHARVLWKTPDILPIKHDFILVEVWHPYMPADKPRLAKHVLCTEGQNLTFDGLNFYCDGVWLHRTKEETWSGSPLEPFAWTAGPVPEGKLYYGSRHPDGFDSRYLGFADAHSVTRLEKVL